VQVLIQLYPLLIPESKKVVDPQTVQVVAFVHYKQSLIPEIELFLHLLHNRVVVFPQTEGAIVMKIFISTIK